MTVYSSSNAIEHTHSAMPGAGDGIYRVATLVAALLILLTAAV